MFLNIFIQIPADYFQLINCTQWGENNLYIGYTKITLHRDEFKHGLFTAKKFQKEQFFVSFQDLYLIQLSGITVTIIYRIFD